MDGQATFRAVLTGILRVTRESIFSDLNNLEVWSILSPGKTADKFGFTDDEIVDMLADFKLSSRHGEVQEWYNGYRFGDKIIYNPWSVVNFIKKSADPIGPQWLNTSSNARVHKELETGGLELKRDPDTYELTYNLQTPNLEIRFVYQQFIQRYFSKLGDSELNDMLQALKRDDFPEFEQRLQTLVLSILSFYDTARHPEAVYHTFLLGLLANLHGSYRFESNAESGFGRADILMIPKRQGLTGKIIELKSINAGEDIDKTAALAFAQIEEKAYATRLTKEGLKPDNIRRLAIIVCGKQVTVRSS